MVALPIGPVRTPTAVQRPDGRAGSSKEICPERDVASAVALIAPDHSSGIVDHEPSMQPLDWSTSIVIVLVEKLDDSMVPTQWPEMFGTAGAVGDPVIGAIDSAQASWTAMIKARNGRAPFR